MRFLLTYNSAEPGPANPEKMEAIARFTEEMRRSGVLLDTGGIMPASARVKQTGGKFSATDGPFPETKELIVGYAIVQCKSHAEAVELTRRFMAVAGDGEGEVRQMLAPEDELPH